MQVVITNTYCWVILFSSVVTMLAAVAALISPRYHDTIPENIALSMVAMAGFTVTLQIGTLGYATGEGLAFMAMSIAVFAVIVVHKQWRPPQCASH